MDDGEREELVQYLAPLLLDDRTINNKIRICRIDFHSHIVRSTTHGDDGVQDTSS